MIKSNLAPHPDPLGITLQVSRGVDLRVVYDEGAPNAYKEPKQLDAAGE